VALLLPAARTLQAHGLHVSWLIGPDAYRLVREATAGIQWIVCTGGLQGGREIARQLHPKTHYILLEQPSLEASLAICVSRSASPVLKMATWPSHTHALERFWNAVVGRPPGADDRAYWGIPYTDMRRQPLVLINLCASTSEREWPLEGYVALIRHAERLELETLVVHAGTARELRLLQELQAFTQVRGEPCVLEELLGYLASAACLVSPDTGPVHLAGITGTPVIGLYNRTRLEQWGPYWSRRWSLQVTTNLATDIDQVLARLTALHQAGFPRCGGEGAKL
jgi:hypothetical protein